MQAQKPVREDDIVASHKVTSVKINHTCNDTILITIPVVHFGHISTLIGTVRLIDSVITESVGQGEVGVLQCMWRACG